MSKITLNNISSFQNDSTAVASYTANNATLTTAFDNTLSRDGSTPNQMLSNLDMNSFRILNLPSPASGTDPLRVQDLSSYVTTTANQIAVPSTTTVGNVVTWNATNGLVLGTGLTNTGSGTVNVLQTSPSITTPTITNPNIIGTATNDAAATGSVGEFVSNTSTLTAITASTATTITSMSLTAGDWDLWGFVQFGSTNPGATTVNLMAASIGTTGATIDTNNVDSYCEISGGGTLYFNFANVPTVMGGLKRVSLSGTTTVFLSGYCAFSGGGSQCQTLGKLMARRRR